MIEQFQLVRLREDLHLKPFNCSQENPNHDLNKFLSDDAKDHAKQLLAVTYIFENNDDDEIIAYFSVLNDSIRHGDTTKSRLQRILNTIPYPKRNYKSHPAVKVGRLAVNCKYQSRGLGSEIMAYIKGYFLDKNKTGCRFIIVDADNNPRTIQFYQKNGFDFLTTSDEKDPNRIMFFDLITLVSES